MVEVIRELIFEMISKLQIQNQPEIIRNNNKADLYAMVPSI